MTNFKTLITSWIYTMKNSMTFFFLTRRYLLMPLMQINFSSRIGLKNNGVFFLASSEIRRCKLLTSCKKCIILVYIDSMVLFYCMFLTTRTKMGMMRQGCDKIDRINFRANVKRFTRKKKKKNNIMSIVRQCKKITSCYFSWCKFSY